MSLFAPYPNDAPTVEPGPDTRCPVCGMYVAKHPAWIAQVEFQDGSAAFFDGSKDMFRYLLDIRKFRPDATRDQVAGIFVTNYATATRIPARTAYFVIGSDVSGPMGNELVPFETEEAAAAFRSEHKGEQVLRFDQIDRDCIDRLESRPRIGSNSDRVPRRSRDSSGEARATARGRYPSAAVTC